jgi:hypothetical protein
VVPPSTLTPVIESPHHPSELDVPTRTTQLLLHRDSTLAQPSPPPTRIPESDREFALPLLAQILQQVLSRL